MSLTKTVGFVAVTTLAIGGAAFGAEQNNDALAQIAELKAQIAELKGAQGSQWLTEQRAAEIRGIVTDVLADSETRSSLQGASGSGYNGGFFLSSADGNYSMKMNVLEQIRWTFNDQSDANNEQVSGFENKRTRLTFGGNMVDTTWTYRLAYNIAYSNSAEDFGADELSDAFVAKDFECGASMTVGQFKLPFSSEYDIDVGNMQFMDYSTVDAFYRAGYGQGIKFDYESDFTRFGIAYVNAIRDANDPWGPGSPEDQWAFSSRVDLKFAGNWGQFTRGQSWKGDGYGVKVGLGAYSLSENTPPGIDATALTIDTSVNFGGANLTAAYYWNEVDNTGTAADGANPTGLIIAGGVFVTDDWELVARYESSSVDINFGGAEDFSALTVGGNCYLSRNQSKFSVDFGYAFDAVSAIYAPFAISNNWVEDPAGEDGQWLIRTQLSFSF